jgi:hypothetical protein
MFKCAVTGKLSKLGEKPFKVVTQKRERVYTQRFRDEEGNVSEVLVGRGWEIVKEVLMSKEGHDAWVAKHGPTES